MGKRVPYTLPWAFVYLCGCAERYLRESTVYTP